MCKEKEEKSVATMSSDMEMGKVFADSGMFPDITSAAQGYVKIVAGRELGLSPMQSLNSFYFVSGRIGVAAQTMAALIKKSGKYDYQVIEITDESCTIEFYVVNGETKKLGVSTYDKKQAAAAGIINKASYKNFPRNMYFARALSNGARWFCPDAISGFYTVEELQDTAETLEHKASVITVDATGEVKNGED